MAKRLLLPILMFVIVCIAHAQESGYISLWLSPGANIPLEYMRTASGLDPRYSIGGFAALNCEYSLPSVSAFYVKGLFEYDFIPTTVNTSLSSIPVGVGAGVALPLLEQLLLKLSLTGGYAFTIYKDVSGGSPFASLDLDVSYLLTPQFSIGAGCSYRHVISLNPHPNGYVPFYEGINVFLGTRINFIESRKKANIEIREINIYPVFPVFFKYYDDNSFGEFFIKNTEKGTITDVRVTFFIKQYMDKPKVCQLIREMKEGQEAKVSVNALFNDSVLSITEATKVTGEIAVEYRYAKNDYRLDKTETVRINDRNAMTWDDDRKAAAFVTSKEPAVLSFAKNIAPVIKEKTVPTANNNFKSAIALFEALGAYGINYIVDPTTPFKELSKNKSSTDFLQFPRQTLEYKAGDCDDLSILTCALLESVGIETAFITVPGHIFIAFSAGMNPDEVKSAFHNPKDLIIEGDKVWIPLEITMIQNGFIKAWQTGAKEWRDGISSKSSHLYPVHDAWALYEPVGYTGRELEVKLPRQKEVAEKYAKAIDEYADAEIKARLDSLTKEKSSANDPSALANRKGVIYARFGKLDEAEEEFAAILAKRDSSDAMVNLGNILYLKSDYRKALEYFEKASKKEPGNKPSIVGIAKACYALENYAGAKSAHSKLAKASPALAEKYGYLVSKTDEAGRAASQAEREAVEWAE